MDPSKMESIAESITRRSKAAWKIPPQFDDLGTQLVQEVKDYAIYLIDAGGHVLWWNEGAELLKGYAPEEIRGRHFRIFYTPEDQATRKPEGEMEMATTDGRDEHE